MTVVPWWSAIYARKSVASMTHIIPCWSAPIARNPSAGDPFYSCYCNAYISSDNCYFSGPFSDCGYIHEIGTNPHHRPDTSVTALMDTGDGLLAATEGPVTRSVVNTLRDTHEEKEVAIRHSSITYLKQILNFINFPPSYPLFVPRWGSAPIVSISDWAKMTTSHLLRPRLPRLLILLIRKNMREVMVLVASEVGRDSEAMYSLHHRCSLWQTLWPTITSK